jgi:hypothetical protein
MSGKALAIGFVAFTIIFGAMLWWFQVHAYYRTIDGVAALEVNGRLVPVGAYEGIDAETSPLKMRGCFRLDPVSLEGAPPAEKPAPLIPPFWFDCFDAETLGADLEAGRASAILAARDEPVGFDRIIAYYPDGRAYEWRQVREE